MSETPETDDIDPGQSVAAPKMPKRVLVADPDNVPVRVINDCALDYIGSLFALTLVSNRLAPDEGGVMRGDLVIAARLRFDIEIAKLMRAKLDAQIAALTKPANVQAN